MFCAASVKFGLCTDPIWRQKKSSLIAWKMRLGPVWPLTYRHRQTWTMNHLVISSPGCSPSPPRSPPGHSSGLTAHCRFAHAFKTQRVLISQLSTPLLNLLKFTFSLNINNKNVVYLNFQEKHAEGQLKFSTSSYPVPHISELLLSVCSVRWFLPERWWEVIWW